MRVPALIVALLALFATPAVARAQTLGSNGDFLMRVGGPLVVASGETVDTAVGIGSDARIDGVVRNDLFVVGGAAQVNGTVGGEIQVVNGSLSLGPSANVHGVVLTNSTLAEDPAARVSAPVQHNSGADFRGVGRVLSWLWWVGSTIFLILVALAAAALAPGPVRFAGRTLTGDLGGTVVAAIIYWIGLPIVAVAILLTIIGIPIGLGILLILLPISWVAGFVVTAQRLGDEIVAQFGSIGPSSRVLAAAAIGVLAIQIIGLIPILGGIIVSLSGLLGAGAIVRALWLGRGPRRALPPDATPVPPPIAPTP